MCAAVNSQRSWKEKNLINFTLNFFFSFHLIIMRQFLARGRPTRTHINSKKQEP